MEMSRLSSIERVLYVRENLIFDAFVLTFRQWRIENRSGMRELGSFNNCTSKRFLDVLKQL